MPKQPLIKFTLIILLLISNFKFFPRLGGGSRFGGIIFNEKVFAQTTPTGIPTCDLCGWCNRAINPRPPDWLACRQCLYDAAGREIANNYYTVVGCLSTKPEKFVQSMLTIIFGAAGGIAFMAVLYGSAVVLTSAGNPEKIQAGRDLITNSIIGIMIIVFSVFLLRVVGFDILKIPGFG